MLRWMMIFPFDGGEVRGQRLPLKAIGQGIHIRIIERELSRGPSRQRLPHALADSIQHHQRQARVRRDEGHQLARVLGVRLDWLLEGIERKERAL